MTPAQQPATHAAQALLGDRLSVAVRQGELELHFQPAVDLSTGAVGDMEALLRWAHPDRGLLWPADFLAAAEESGLVLSLGQWVLERAAAEAVRWPAGHCCWINVSAAELADPTYPGRVGATIAAVGLPEGALGIDLPEHALAGMGEDAVTVCENLHAVGAALALEHGDVARGIPPVAAGLAIDHIKVSRSLVRGIDADATLRAHVRGVVHAAQVTGASLAAVGVESWPEAATLVELGVVAGHGFLFSPPQRADRARWLLTRGVSPRGRVPVTQQAVFPAQMRFAPMNGAGNVHPIGGHDPFGRHGAHPR